MALSLDSLHESSQNRMWLGSAGMGALRVALLFGSVGVALALILTPLMERRMDRAAYRGAGVDSFTTGSIPDGQRRQAYTMRRSVLQSSPQALCIISADGSRSGDC